MNKAIIKGCGTALVTPFDRNGLLDSTALQLLIEKQIKAGTHFLVPCGTTGESPTLSHEEHDRVIEIVVEQAAGRVPVIAGTGSNSTVEAVRLTRQAKKAGATAALVVVPYYNRPTQEGLYHYFTTVADVGLPVIIYNIPKRTGADVRPETMARLMQHQNIIGIKEATGDLDQMTQDILLCGGASYLSGDDTLTLPHMIVGGHGVISVISNLIPDVTAQMVNAALAKDWDNARTLHIRMFPLCKAMFLESNPGPIKAAMAMMGLIQPVWRSPIVQPEAATIAAIRAEMEKFGLTITHPM